MTQTGGIRAPSSDAAATPSFFQSVDAYFRLWRYEGKALVGCFIVMYLGWIALAGGFEQPDAFVMAGLATAGATCIVIAVFLINDAADRDIDRVVHPERPIPQGRSARHHICAFGAALLAAGVALGLLVNARFTLIVALLAGLTALHYGYLKRRLRIACSSELITPLMSVLFPLSAFALTPRFRLDVLFPVLAFIYFADLAHDLLGGVHDQEGDRRQNVRTFALAVGDRPTVWISLASFLLAAVSGVLVYERGRLGWIYLATFAILSVLMAYHYVRLLLARGESLRERAGKANHFGGFYFFVVSGAILPDYLSRQLIG